MSGIPYWQPIKDEVYAFALARGLNGYAAFLKECQSAFEVYLVTREIFYTGDMNERIYKLMGHLRQGDERIQRCDS